MDPPPRLGGISPTSPSGRFLFQLLPRFPPRPNRQESKAGRPRRTLDRVTEPYRPFVGGPFRWRLGLRPLDLARWIEVGDDHGAILAEKARLAAAHHDTVFGAIDGIEPDATEVLDTLLEHLLAHFPDWYGVDGNTIVAAGQRLARAELHPLDLAGRLVDEDIAVLVDQPGGLVFGGGSICFPNRWDLRSKLGKSLAGVHEPVPGLNEQLGEPIDAVFARLTPARSFWRLGWTVLDTPERYQPVDGTAPAGLGAGDPANLHLRVERETIRRLPATGVVVFTIRTYLTSLTSLAGDTDDARRLADALVELPDDVAEYKSLSHGWGGSAASWLSAHVAER